MAITSAVGTPQVTAYSLFGFGCPQVLFLRVNPTVAPGVDAPLATLGLRQNGATGELWLKTDATPTGWTQK
jgi:hypothetical protein